jgi:hypothetical protein
MSDGGAGTATVSERHLREVRQRYNIAHAAYQTHAKVVSDARMGGALPAKALLDNEAGGVRALHAVRQELMAAMAALNEQMSIA